MTRFVHHSRQQGRTARTPAVDKRRERLAAWKGWKAAEATGQGDAEYWKQRYEFLTRHLAKTGEL